MPSTSLTCPRCQTTLQIRHSGGTRHLYCPDCSGRGVTFEGLRAFTSRKLFARIITAGKTTKGLDNTVAPEAQVHLPCPHCRQGLIPILIDEADPVFEIDVCATCRLIWLDGGEMAHLPVPDVDSAKTHGRAPLHKRASSGVPPTSSSPWWRQTVHTPDRWQHWVLGLLGMPIELDAPEKTRYPVVNWSLLFFISLFSILAFQNHRFLIDNFGLIPRWYGRHLGLDFVTAFLLHGSWLHLIGNMYFLFLFGDNVEDDLGSLQYLALVAAATFLGDVLHILGDPASEIPCIGASGGISGVLLYYTLRYPKAKIGVMYFFHILPLPVWLWGGFWFVSQIVGARMQLLGAGNVSYLAHVGGAIAGILFWLKYRKT